MQIHYCKNIQTVGKIDYIFILKMKKLLSNSNWKDTNLPVESLNLYK